MVATNWVQIIKVVLLLCGALAVTVMSLAQFGFDFSALIDRAPAIHPMHAAILGPIAIAADPVSGLSLGIALMFGTSGLPHILMRFFTVIGAREQPAAPCSSPACSTLCLLPHDVCNRLRRGRPGAAGPGLPSCRRRPARRRQHGSNPPQPHGRRRCADWLHLGRRLRHHPYNGSRA